MDALYAHAGCGDLDLDARSQCVGHGPQYRCMLSTTTQAISIKLATAVGHFVHDLDVANVYMA